MGWGTEEMEDLIEFMDANINIISLLGLFSQPFIPRIQASCRGRCVIDPQTDTHFGTASIPFRSFAGRR